MFTEGNLTVNGGEVKCTSTADGAIWTKGNILIKGGANARNAKLFIDFVTSKECQTAMESEINVRPARSDVPMTTEGRVATEDLVTLPYPEVDSADLKSRFQDILTSLG